MEDESKMLLAYVSECLATQGLSGSRLDTFHCDCDKNGEFKELAGFRDARDALLAAQRDRDPKAVLLVGHRSRRQIETQIAKEPGLANLLRWPGLAYVESPFDDAKLAGAADQALTGCVEPLPQLIYPQDLLSVVQNARHWAMGLRSAVQIKAEDFRAASKGELALHDSQLAPAVAFSSKHAGVIQKLGAFALAAPVPVGRVAGDEDWARKASTHLAHTFFGFERTWAAMEAAKAEIRDAPGTSLQLCVARIDEVTGALTCVINAIGALQSIGEILLEGGTGRDADIDC